MIQGTWSEQFTPVVEAFAEHFRRGAEIGAAASLVVAGQAVVDIWAGAADAGSGQAWEQSTCCVVFSCTKAMTATVALHLVDQGQLDLDEPVAAYWPEFADHGKGAISLAMVLSHVAGLPALETPHTVEEANDAVSVAAHLARQRPRWEPGLQHGYHALTYGWLVGEVIRRATKESVGTHLARLADAHGLEVWIGAGEEVRAKAAELIDPPVREAPPGPSTASPPSATVRLGAALRDPESEPFAALMNPPLLARARRSNDDDLLAAEWPAVNGLATARGLAGLLDAVANGGLLHSATLRRATSVHARGLDRVLLHGSAFGLGFMLPSTVFGAAKAGSFGHTGAGGSLCVGDPKRGFGFGYITNLWGADPLLDHRGGRLLSTIYQCLDRELGAAPPGSTSRAAPKQGPRGWLGVEDQFS